MCYNEIERKDSMKVRLDYDENIEEVEIVIRCREITSEIEMIQKKLCESFKKAPHMIYYKDSKEYYFPLTDILFFETENSVVFAHTSDQVYQVKYRLYELEKILPNQFLRVSKSTILNITHVFSIDRTFPSYHLVQFYKSHKKVYVSRMYYKQLKHKLEERRSL